MTTQSGGEVELLAFKWADTLSESEQDVLRTSSIRRLQNAINDAISTRIPAQPAGSPNQVPVLRRGDKITEAEAVEIIRGTINGWESCDLKTKAQWLLEFYDARTAHPSPTTDAPDLTRQSTRAELIATPNAQQLARAAALDLSKRLVCSEFPEDNVDKIAAVIESYFTPSEVEKEASRD